MSQVKKKCDLNAFVNKTLEIISFFLSRQGHVAIRIVLDADVDGYKNAILVQCVCTSSKFLKLVQRSDHDCFLVTHVVLLAESGFRCQKGAYSELERFLF